MLILKSYLSTASFLSFFSQAENCENGEAELGLSWAVKVLDASKDGEVVKFTIQTNMVRRCRVQLIRSKIL